MTVIWCTQNQSLTMKTQFGEKQKMQIHVGVDEKLT